MTPGPPPPSFPWGEQGGGVDGAGEDQADPDAAPEDGWKERDLAGHDAAGDGREECGHVDRAGEGQSGLASSVNNN